MSTSSPTKTDPRRLMQDIQAQRELDASGPTTWHALVKDIGHARVLARQLLDNEKSFRIAVARWYKALGRDIIAALRANDSYTWLNVARDAVTDEHRESLRKIVEQHIRREALLSAGIEWTMHQKRPSTKAVLHYVQKGVWDFVKRLPQKVLTAVKLAVAGVMAIFLPDRVIEPILDRVEKTVIEKLTKEPSEQPIPSAKIAEAVKDGVFNRDRTEAMAVGVAVTHSTQGANLGTGAAGQVLAAGNLVNAQRWMTLHGSGKLDNKVRPSHKKANGQTVGIGERFTLMMSAGGTETCLYPADPSLSAGNSRYCRCLRIYVWVEQRAAA